MKEDWPYQQKWLLPVSQRWEQIKNLEEKKKNILSPLPELRQAFSPVLSRQQFWLFIV